MKRSNFTSRTAEQYSLCEKQRRKSRDAKTDRQKQSSRDRDAERDKQKERHRRRRAEIQRRRRREGEPYPAIFGRNRNFENVPALNDSIMINCWIPNRRGRD